MKKQGYEENNKKIEKPEDLEKELDNFVTGSNEQQNVQTGQTGFLDDFLRLMDPPSQKNFMTCIKSKSL